MYFINIDSIRFHDHPVVKPFKVLGSAPLFFYVCRIFFKGYIDLPTKDLCMYFILSIPFALGQHKTTLGGVYIECIIGLLLLYPLVSKYADFKQRQPKESLWRMF
jgi:hypothetical protein